jgi:nucleotide-binding universal stress UspA family protein
MSNERAAEPSKVDTGPILVAIDFSSHSEAALDWAIDASIRFDAPLLLLHVLHDPAAAPGYYVAADAGDRPLPQAKVAEDMMSELEERSRRDDPRIENVPGLETMLVAGIPATRILEVAEKTGAQLIVMGSQGRTGLSNLLLGSKAQRVVQLSTLPVTVVRAREGDGEAQTTAPASRA